MIDAIEENPKLAKIYINEEENTCFVLLEHYLFVAGDINDENLSYLYNQVLTEKVKNELEIITVFYLINEWKNSITNLYPNNHKIYERSLYRIKPTYVVDDFNNHHNIFRITNELLNSNIDNTNMIVEEVISTGTYNNIDDFIQRGIGFTPVIDNKVCGFCTSEYPTKSEIAIGIKVLEQYKNQGIAKAMTKMFLNEASKRDLTVNWECWKNNISSVNTAKSCGFEKIADYPVIFIDFYTK